MSELSTAVGLISGGLDSTVVAAYMREQYDQSYFMFCNYGQKTLPRELAAFEAVSLHYEPQMSVVVDLTWMRSLGKSALFEEGTRLNSLNRKREYVPFRNACLLSAAVALAETVEAEAVLIGSTGGDTTCPDNSSAFIAAFESMIKEGTMTERNIQVVAPLITLDKKGVVSLGRSLKAPFELSWSCHNNIGYSACGGCSNCGSRRQAFTDLGLTDPLTYDSAES